eukprot:GEMP01073221.1.p1 GENE.GEMP01073221.1~~GEMP01073221.1.p1  ORF type:complete len:231 (+),score=20.35 GEMP01073221.1:25-717(+)
MFMLVIALLVSCVAYVNGDDGFATADNRRRILASTPASNAWQRAQRAFKQFGASEHTLAVFQQRSEVWTIHGLWLNSDIGDGDAGAKKHQRGKTLRPIYTENFKNSRSPRRVTLDEMLEKWPAVVNEDAKFVRHYSFWEHEWAKHAGYNCIGCEEHGTDSWRHRLTYFRQTLDIFNAIREDLPILCARRRRKDSMLGRIKCTKAEDPKGGASMTTYLHAGVLLLLLGNVF